VHDTEEKVENSVSLGLKALVILIKLISMQMFVEEVMTLVELDVLRDALVGQPGVSGLSTEQRKRHTIAVELVANPSIIFMDDHQKNSYSMSY
jgi:ABC-type multidrug transport system ATPase subunit